MFASEDEQYDDHDRPAKRQKTFTFQRFAQRVQQVQATYESSELRSTCNLHHFAHLFRADVFRPSAVGAGERRCVPSVRRSAVGASAWLQLVFPGMYMLCESLFVCGAQ